MVKTDLKVEAAKDYDVSASIISGNQDKDAILYLGTPYYAGGGKENVKKAAIIAEGQGSSSRSKLHFA